MKKCRVISGKYDGRIGERTDINELGLVMFYPLEGEYPYRVCLSINEIEDIEKV